MRRTLGIILALVVAYACSGLACANTSLPHDVPPDAGTATDAGDADAKRVRDSAHDEHTKKDAGPPRLTALSVSAADSGAAQDSGGGADSGGVVALVPSFEPDIHDYYVRCAAGTNVLRVSMKASAGADSFLAQPLDYDLESQQTRTVTVLENQPFVAAATDGKATTEYWVRCLPHDFPQMAWDPHPEAGVPTAAYYLVGNYNKLVGEGAYAMVLDSHGVPVWYQSVGGLYGVFNVDTIVSGSISFVPSLTGEPYEVQSLDPWLKTYVGVDGGVDDHELQVLSNGDFLVLATPLVQADMTGVTIPYDGGTKDLGPDATIEDCEILEVGDAGVVNWSWQATAHLDPRLTVVTPYDFPCNGSPACGGPGNPIVEAYHCNSIDVDPANGNLLVSARDDNSIFYIQKSTGKILWKMGGTAATKDNATYVPVPSAFHNQHDARFQGWTPSCSGAEGHGQVSLFDDETYIDASARGVVYNVTVGPGDGGASADCGPPADAGPTGASVAWAHEGSGNSDVGGSFRILDGGARIIGWGLPFASGGRVAPSFTEVDVNHHDMLDFTMDPQTVNSTFRAIKVPLTALDLGVMRQTAGLPAVPP